MSIKVVKVDLRARDNFTHYIGRDWAGIGGSIFHNPFHIGWGGSREDAIRQFAIYWYAPAQKWLREKALQEIPEDAILGCWCAPLACHGDIIAGYLAWKRQEISWYIQRMNQLTLNLITPAPRTEVSADFAEKPKADTPSKMQAVCGKPPVGIA